MTNRRTNRRFLGFHARATLNLFKLTLSTCIASERMDQLNNHQKTTPTVVEDEVKNLTVSERYATSKLDSAKNDSAHNFSQQNRASSLSPFAAVTKSNVYVVRTAPAASSVTHPRQIKSTADGQSFSTQPLTRTTDNATARFTRDHIPHSTTLAVIVPLPDTAKAAVLAQPVAHHVHSSPFLTTQSYYSGKLITDNYSTTSSPTLTPSISSHEETRNESNLTKISSDALTGNPGATDAVPSMDTALSSIFSSTEFFAGWIGGAGGVVIGHPFDTVKVRMQTRVSVPTATDNAAVSANKPVVEPTLTGDNLVKHARASVTPDKPFHNSALRSLIEKAVALPSSAGLSPSLSLNYNTLNFGHNNLSNHGRVPYPSTERTTTGLNPHHPGKTSTVHIAPHNHDRRPPTWFSTALTPEITLASAGQSNGESATASFMNAAKQFVETGVRNATAAASKSSAAKAIAEVAVDYDPMPWSSRTGIVDMTKSDGMFSILEKMVRDEGARSMYRGMSFPLLSAGIINAVFFGTYQASSRIIDKIYPFRNLDSDNANWRRRYATMFAAGAIGGATQLSIAVPVEVIKIKLQVCTGRPKLTDSYHTCRDIVRQSGVRGLYRGFGVQAMRDIPACACYMLLYESFLDLFHYMRDRQGVREQTSSILLAGGLSGMISWQIVIPFDVIKSRMQAGDSHIRPTVPVITSVSALSATSKLSSALEGGKLSRWIKSCGLVKAWREVVREEGWRGLTRGMLPVSLRALPTNAAIFYLYETSFAYLDKLGGRPK